MESSVFRLTTNAKPILRILSNDGPWGKRPGAWLEDNHHQAIMNAQILRDFGATGRTLIMNTDIPSHSWQVLLLGGPSGVGKTCVSYRLAHHFAIGITEVDDFQVILERMTTPTEQPVLHYWRTHPEAGNQPAEEIVKRTIAVGQVMAPALEAVIANHIESRAPIVLEGDFILPMLTTSFSESSIQSQVRTLFLYEESEEQFRHNFLKREPEHGLQEKRAQVSWLYGQWLKQEAERVGTLTLPARPWDTLFERILMVLK